MLALEQKMNLASLAHALRAAGAEALCVAFSESKVKSGFYQLDVEWAANAVPLASNVFEALGCACYHSYTFDPSTMTFKMVKKDIPVLKLAEHLTDALRTLYEIHLDSGSRYVLMRITHTGSVRVTYGFGRHNRGQVNAFDYALENAGGV